MPLELFRPPLAHRPMCLLSPAPSTWLQLPSSVRDRRLICRPHKRPRTGFKCQATIPVPDNTHVVSDLNWDTDFNAHFVKGKLIGQGSFGSVYLGIDLHTGQQVGSIVVGSPSG